MSGKEDEAIHEVRRELIRLFQGNDYRLTDRADRDGRKILLERRYKPSTQWGICAYILDQLLADFPMRAVGMGEPPGSRGVGYVMYNVDGDGLYIKLKIEEGEVWVLSFHY